MPVQRQEDLSHKYELNYFLCLSFLLLQSLQVPVPVTPYEIVPPQSLRAA